MTGLTARNRSTKNSTYLTIIPLALVGYEMVNGQRELAIIISYPTSTSGIIVLLKTATKYR